MEKAEAHFVECGLNTIVKKVVETYTITSSLNDAIGSSITLDPEGETEKEAGESLELTLTIPTEDYNEYEVLKAYWSLDGDLVQTDNIEYGLPTSLSYTIEDIQDDHTITVTISVPS